MKIYEKPEIQVETFEIEDIITASSGDRYDTPIEGM